jgi:hypothetical protein
MAVNSSRTRLGRVLRLSCQQMQHQRALPQVHGPQQQPRGWRGVTPSAASSNCDAVQGGDGMPRTGRHRPRAQQRRPSPKRRAPGGAPASPCAEGLQHTVGLHSTSMSELVVRSELIVQRFSLISSRLKPDDDTSSPLDDGYAAPLLRRLTASAVVGAERPAAWAGRAGGLAREALEGAACACSVQGLHHPRPWRSRAGAYGRACALQI